MMRPARVPRKRAMPSEECTSNQSARDKIIYSNNKLNKHYRLLFIAILKAGGGRSGGGHGRFGAGGEEDTSSKVAMKPTGHAIGGAHARGILI